LENLYSSLQAVGIYTQQTIKMDGQITGEKHLTEKDAEEIGHGIKREMSQRFRP